jgi:hypothetical protein
MAAQNLLFTEPLYTSTGLWCELAEGIDPARWAEMARRLGTLSPAQFKKAEKRLLPDPDSMRNRIKRLFAFDQAECANIPPVCCGRLEIDR